MKIQALDRSSITIGVTTVAFSRNEKLVSELKASGFRKIKINITGKRLSQKELIIHLQNCEAAIVGLDKIDADFLKSMPNLKVISKYGVGLDNIDLEAAKNHDVDILHTSGINKRSVSEMTLGFMLGLSRNLYTTSNQLKNGNWNKNGGVQLTGKTIGIIGVGNIGKDLVRLLQPFDCKILLNDIVDISEFCEKYTCKSVSKEELFIQSDIVSLHIPLSDKTFHLINKKTFDKLKPTSFLINTARGEIINLIDLKNALLKNKIAGAAIDVYDKEPPLDHELLKLSNLINTPHIGGNAIEAVEAMGRSSIFNLINYYNSHNK